MKKITKFIVWDLCKANGFEIENLHTSRGDIEGIAKLMALLKIKRILFI